MVCLLPGTSFAQPPALSTVMARAGQYVSALAEQFASVVGEEHAEQSSSGAPFEPVTERRIGADILVVRVPGTATWMGFRDVFEINGRRVRDREDRLLKLFVESPATALAQAKRIADESARYNVGSLTRNFNLPTTALFVLLPSTQPRFTYRKAGEKTVDGVRYWRVVGKETTRPTMVRTTMGRDAEMLTEYLIEPESGRVARTWMRLATPAVATIEVGYRGDEKLGFWVPYRMDEYYEGGGTRITSTAMYSNFRRFQVSTETTFRD
jgi:hypothetical protein